MTWSVPENSSLTVDSNRRTLRLHIISSRVYCMLYNYTKQLLILKFQVYIKPAAAWLCMHNNHYCPIHREIHSNPYENLYLYQSATSNINGLAPNYVAYPSPQLSESRIKFTRPLTGATPPVDDDIIREAYDQQLKRRGYKKPTKYFKHTANIKLKSSLKTNDKNCCEDRWWWLTSKNNFAPYQLMQQPRRPTYYPSNQDYGYRIVDDVKPVVEHIEGDLKYDFRTGKHSF